MPFFKSLNLGHYFTRSYFTFVLVNYFVFTSFNFAARAGTSLDLQKVSPPVTQRSNIKKNVFDSTTPGILLLRASKLTRIRISISKPSLQSGKTPDPSGTIRKAFLAINGQNIEDKDGEVELSLSALETEIQTNIQIERPREFFGGQYIYDTTVTVSEVKN